MVFLIDQVAKELALRRYVVPECLHVPIAAVDENAIRNYVGDILGVIGRGSPSRAFIVHAKEPPPVDLRFPIWDIEGSKIFHQRVQLWVHVNYTRYRPAYQKAFPTEDISGKILSHAMNRRLAVLKGFQYTRITAASRSANSSAAFSEGWAVEGNSSPEQMAINRKRSAFIQYADLTDLMLMLDMNLGGGVMDAVNVAQRLIDPRPDSEPASALLKTPMLAKPIA
jgi:hypothetical protein